MITYGGTSIARLHYVGATTLAAVRAPSDGKKRQGRYELGALLGRGGMAEVFAGSSMGDHGFKKPVAIKRLLPDLATDLVFVARLIDEAKLLVGMQHGNIVSVLDLAREGDDVFLVMEFVDGPSVRQLIKARGSRGLSLGISTYILAAAAAGLAFAHTRPTGAIIHADISPSNLLLTTSGEVRVADFGIARREGGIGFGVEGKWAYMAPEQVRGEPLAPSSDMFALGVVMYELLTGLHPFGHNVTSDDRATAPIRVMPPRRVRSSVPPALDAICMRCLATDPAARYPTMRALIDALTDARFANGYREGASDLAEAIREVAPAMAIEQPAPASRTQTTDRPPTGVTIVTRSLLSSPKSTRALGSQSDSHEPVLAEGTASRNSSGQIVAIPYVAEPVPVAPKKSRWGLYVLGAAALAGGGAAIAIQMGPSDLPTAPAPSTTLTITPLMAELPVVVPPATATATALVPPPVAAPAPKPRPTPKTPSPAPAPKPHKAPIAEAGTFRLSTTTWAYASIDGGAQQEVSMVRTFSLPAGRHTVRVFNDDLKLKPVTRTITVDPSKNHVLKVDLESGTAKELD